MEKFELTSEKKNQILNLGILLLALFFAFKIFQAAQVEIDKLVGQKQSELKKNQVAENILNLEETLESYKKVFVKKDISSVMDTVSNIARSCNVKVVSIKPGREDATKDYLKSSFILVVNIPNYHALGEFVSKIESQKDIYLVDVINIDASGVDQSRNTVGINLTVNLTMSTISYL